jgi:hypothetical protein
MALVALRQGHGNRDLAGELLKTVFVTSYLADPDHLVTHEGHFTQAETAIKVMNKDAAQDNGWHLEETNVKGSKRFLPCMMRNLRPYRRTGLNARSSV